MVHRPMLTMNSQCLSPQMIILRVLMGRAWTARTSLGTSGQGMTGEYSYGASGTVVVTEPAKEGSLAENAGEDKV